MRRAEAFDRLHRAETEYLAARFAIRHMLATWGGKTDVARAAREDRVTVGELRRAGDRLEVTFVLRVFWEFEAILRDYWMAGLNRTTRPDMKPLIDAIATRRQMAPADRQAAHDVRAFRNDIVHAGQLVPALGLPGCLNKLGRYLRWLPQQW